MLSRRPATWLRLVPLALVIPGCGGGQTAVSPSSVSAPAPTPSVGLTCALGTTDCSSVMQGQTLTFTASPGSVATGTRSATLTFGDGTPDLDLGTLAAPATVAHEYVRLGTFTARLEVTTGGEMRAASVAIKVGTVVTASIGATNLGDLNVEATADIQGAAVAQYEWLFEPGAPAVVTFQPRVLFTYSSPGYKAVELKVVLADGRVVRASAHVIVGREHEA
jgi:hypothetical protein